MFDERLAYNFIICGKVEKCQIREKEKELAWQIPFLFIINAVATTIFHYLIDCVIHICNDRVGTRKYQNEFTIDNFLLLHNLHATMTDFVNEWGRSGSLSLYKIQTLAD